MTLIPNNDLIDYDNKWNANLDSLRNYIVDGYDFTNDYEAFIIKTNAPIIASQEKAQTDLINTKKRGCLISKLTSKLC